MTPNEFKDWRERLGLSLSAAARVLGVSRTSVIEWEAGRTPISLRTSQQCLAIELLNRAAGNRDWLTILLRNGHRSPRHAEERA